MLNAFTVRNFKCLKAVTVAPLSRVSIVTGMNNVGKTALLEALFLHAGFDNPVLTRNINTFRGITSYKLDASDIWGWLFTNREFKAPISLEGIWEDGTETALRISLESPSRSVHKLPDGGHDNSNDLEGPSGLAIQSQELLYQYEDSKGEQFKSRAKLRPDGNIELSHSRAHEATGYFCSARTRFYEQDANLLDQVIRKKELPKLVERLSPFEPGLSALSVSTSSGRPLILVDVGLPEFIPLPYAGEGLAKLVSIMLRLMTVPGGLVLIDEAENGLHYSALKRLWKAIAEVARETDVQVIASTHSWECVRAAHEAMSEFLEYDLSVCRLERPGLDVRAVMYKKDDLELAVASEKELR